MEILFITFRSLVVYFFIIFAIRIFGKKELSQLSVIDLVFILLISNSVQNAMVGQDNSLVGGLVAAGTLFIINKLLENLLFHSEKANSLLVGNPIMLIYHGKAIAKHLDKAKITHEELEAVIREHGVKEIGEVDLAVLETDGNISVLSQNYQHKTTRKRHAHKAINQTT